MNSAPVKLAFSHPQKSLVWHQIAALDAVNGLIFTLRTQTPGLNFSLRGVFDDDVTSSSALTQQDTTNGPDIDPGMHFVPCIIYIIPQGSEAQAHIHTCPMAGQAECLHSAFVTASHMCTRCTSVSKYGGRSRALHRDLHMHKCTHFHLPTCSLPPCTSPTLHWRDLREVPEVAECAHSSCREVSYFTVRWA